MIVLFTDFGLEGPYIGQVEAVLQQQAPGVPVIKLFSDLPPFDIEGAAYLLPAYAGGFPPGTVFLCVVDPGVGSARPGVVVQADTHWYVGPNEGLFSQVMRRAGRITCRELALPANASSSFHGRDVFAPAAARVARGVPVDGEPVATTALARPDWPDDLYRVVYIDRFGNAITGRAGICSRSGRRTERKWSHTASGAYIFRRGSRHGVLVRQRQRSGGVCREPGQGGCSAGC